MRSDDLMGVDVPWMFTKVLGTIHLTQKPEFDAWLNQELADGEMGMIIVVPLVADKYHAAAFRYYRGCVLVLIANDMGEPDIEAAHAVMAERFLPLVPVKSKQRTEKDTIKFVAKSTSMLSMPCAEFCDYLDRLIAWASTERGLIVPMADPAWKWKQQQRQLARPA